MAKVFPVLLKDDDLVFASAGGLPQMPNSVSRAFRQIARAAGLEGVSLHGLRHTHASLMLRAGVPMKVVQERLGHATMAITADIYTLSSRNSSRTRRDGSRMS